MYVPVFSLLILKLDAFFFVLHLYCTLCKALHHCGYSDIIYKHVFPEKETASVVSSTASSGSEHLSIKTHSPATDSLLLLKKKIL